MFRKTVIAVSNLPTASQFLHWGAQLTRTLQSDLTVLYVSHTRHLGPLHLSVTAEKMAEWGVEPPSFRLLREAEALLKAEGALQLDERGQVVMRHSFKDIGQGVGEVHLKGIHQEDIRLRLREGLVVPQVLKEVEDPSYDLIFIGTRGQRGLGRNLLGNVAHDVALRAPCSVLVTKNLDKARAVLIGVTDRPSSGEAVVQGLALAKALELPLRLIAIAPLPHHRTQAQALLNATLPLIATMDYEAEALLKEGDPAKALIETAGEDHVLALGRAPMSLVRKVFLGDISQKILERGRCSVFIAVPPRRGLGVERPERTVTL